MANGAAALALLPTASATPAAGQKDIRAALGHAMADATEALGAGLADLDAGGRLSDANRTRGGETIAAVVELWLGAFGEIDFGVIALAEGRRVLLARHGATLRQQLGTDAGIDDVFCALLSHVLTVANKVAAIEMAYRAH